MKVLLIGANGFLGPHVVRALAAEHELRITDIKPPPADIREAFQGHEFRDVDVTSAEQVLDAAGGMDAIVNLAVVRADPVLAFRVNTLGCWNVMQAAVRQGIRRVINTGPHFTVAGPCYEQWDHAIGPDVPPHPGTHLYPLTKSLGQEVCRLFAESHDVYVQEYLFYNFREAKELKPGAGGVPFIGDPVASGSLVSPEVFHEFCLPYLTQLVRHIHRHGVWTGLHVCGNTARIIADLAATGADVLSLDEVDLSEVRRELGPQAVLMGNVSTELVRTGRPGQVLAAARACLGAAGPRLVLSTACDVPADAPEENVRAIVEAGRSDRSDASDRSD